MVASMWVLGDFAWDVLIRTNSELLRGGDTFGEVMLTPGGSAANVAVWAQRCGFDTEFVGKIGRDRMGELAREDLAREGVRAHLVETDAQLTGSVAVFVDHTGERSMVSGRGADHFLMSSELPPRSMWQPVEHLHLTAWSFFADPPRTAARAAARIAKAAGATISFDPGSFQMIQDIGVATFLSFTTDLDIDILLPNHEEGQVLTGLSEPAEICAALADVYGCSLVMLKLDAEGSFVWVHGEGTKIPPATNNLVDATGAGDSYAGAFLSRYLIDRDAVDAARFATLVSAWVIEHPGARSAPDARLQSIIGT